MLKKYSLHSATEILHKIEFIFVLLGTYIIEPINYCLIKIHILHENN